MSFFSYIQKKPPVPDISSLRQCDVCAQIIRKADTICEWCGATYFKGSEGTLECQGMLCHRCGYQNNRDAVTCAQCKDSFAIRCSKCGTEGQIQEKGCRTCNLSYSDIAKLAKEELGVREKKEIRQQKILMIVVLAVVLCGMALVFEVCFRHIKQWSDVFVVASIEGFLLLFALPAIKSFLDLDKKTKRLKKVQRGI